MSELHFLLVGSDENEFRRVRESKLFREGESIHLEWICSFQDGIDVLRQHQYEAILFSEDVISESRADFLELIREESQLPPLLILEKTMAGDASNEPEVLAHWSWNLIDNSFLIDSAWQQCLKLPVPTLEGDPESWFVRVHPSDLEGLRSNIASLVGGELEAMECDYRMLHIDGQYHWFRTTARAKRDERGSAVSLRGTVRAIPSWQLRNANGREKAGTQGEFSRSESLNAITELSTQLLESRHPGLCSSQRGMVRDILRHAKALLMKASNKEKTRNRALKAERPAHLI